MLNFSLYQSPLSQLSVNVHLSMMPVPSRRKLSKRGLDISFQPPPAPAPPVVFSTSALNATFLYPRTVSRDNYIRESSTGPGHRPEGAGPSQPHTSSERHHDRHSPGNDRRTRVASGSSSRLANASEKKLGLWKIFNPALCRVEEMPKLLILRDCTAVTSQGTPRSVPTQPPPVSAAASSSGRTPSSPIIIKVEDESDEDEDMDREEDENERILEMLRKGTFDIGSIDYRGQYVTQL